MISQRGIDLIKEFEGCVLTAYRDPVGVWTVAYGHTHGVYEGQTVTQAEAEEMLKSDLVGYNEAVMAYDDIYHWNQNQEDALTSFSYNLGAGAIAQLTKKGTRTIEEISRCIPLYNKAGGKVLEGLVRRRQAERELFDEPVQASESLVSPEVDNVPSESTESHIEPAESLREAYTEDEVYTVCVMSALNVRTGAGVENPRVGYSNLTADGKKHANDWGALLPDTRVTCLETRQNSDGSVWMRIPSGWVCAVDSDGHKYVK